MKNLISTESNEILSEVKSPERQQNNGTQIEISNNYTPLSKCHEDEPFVKHAQSIRCILNEHHEDEPNNEEKLRIDQELKFKFASLVMDRLFLIAASIYSIITFVGLITSI